MIRQLLFAGILGLVLVFVFTTTASAHNTQPRLEISTERLIPGGVVDVRGVGFGMEETVMLALIGSGLEVSLGEMITDAEGEFLHIAVLPTDLAEGAYYFRATTSHHWVLSPALTVQGVAIVEGDEQAFRDHDEDLLVPMPTYAPGVVPGVVTISAPIVSSPVEAPAPPSGWGTNMLILTGLMVLVAVVVLRLGRKRSE